MKRAGKEFWLRYKDAWIGIGLIVMATAMIFGVRGVEPQKGMIDVGSGFFPTLVCVLLIVLSLLLIGETILKNREQPVEQAEGAQQKSDDWLTRHGVLCSMAAIVLYVVTVKPLGFVIASAIYLFLQMNIMVSKGKRRVWFYLALAVVIPILTYYVFTRGLSLMLPTGILRNILY